MEGGREEGRAALWKVERKKARRRRKRERGEE
jgi:hypothetical protein